MSEKSEKTKYSDTADTKWSATEPGNEVVISGIAGRFPESDSVKDLEVNLFNKVDMITNDNRRCNNGMNIHVTII